MDLRHSSFHVRIACCPVPGNTLSRDTDSLKEQGTRSNYSLLLLSEPFRLQLCFALHYLFWPDFAADLKIAPHNAPFGLELRSEVLMRMT